MVPNKSSWSLVYIVWLKRFELKLPVICKENWLQLELQKVSKLKIWANWKIAVPKIIYCSPPSTSSPQNKSGMCHRDTNVSWSLWISKLLQFGLKVLKFWVQLVFLVYLGQFKSKSLIQGHFCKLVIKTFHLAPRHMGIYSLLIKILAPEKQALQSSCELLRTKDSNIQKLSWTFRDLQGPSGTYRNLQEPSGTFRKPQEISGNFRDPQEPLGTFLQSKISTFPVTDRQTYISTSRAAPSQLKMQGFVTCICDMYMYYDLLMIYYRVFADNRDLL